MVEQYCKQLRHYEWNCVCAYCVRVTILERYVEYTRQAIEDFHQI